jgi:ribose 1,5-bisphosphokinase
MSQIGPGTFVAVVGPSGAGKDSVMAYAMAALAGDPRYVLARRIITRLADAKAEDHDTLSEGAFLAAEAAGDFALSWGAHGHRYAIPLNVDDGIRSGSTVIANLSRKAIPAMRARYANSLVVNIFAQPEIIAARLAGRGRESQAEIAARLSRMGQGDEELTNAIAIENSGPIDIAGEQLLSLLRAAPRSAEMTSESRAVDQ